MSFMSASTDSRKPCAARKLRGETVLKARTQAMVLSAVVPKFADYPISSIEKSAGAGSVATFPLMGIPLCCSPPHKVEERWNDRLQRQSG